MLEKISIEISSVTYTLLLRVEEEMMKKGMAEQDANWIIRRALEFYMEKAKKA